MKILITGGAGFVGSSLAKAYRQEFPQAKISVFDNLRRRGAELNLNELQKRGIDFIHGDVRSQDDLLAIPDSFDFLIEASAEPSVHAGNSGSPAYVTATNLSGAIHCLEFVRQRGGALLFLSTSRVYSLAALQALPLQSKEDRFILQGNLPAGCSAAGIKEDFSCATARSLYGSSKLAAELFLQEYADTFKVKCLVNRCGVIAGAGQFGKTDQGVFTLWLANHYFGLPLRYTGFGGEGHQVRDLLHPQDLYQLIRQQMEQVNTWQGDIYNVGGGMAGSVSLAEWSKIAQNLSQKKLTISQDKKTAHVDIPYYVSDIAKANKQFGWQPKILPETIAADIFRWIDAEAPLLATLFKAAP